MNAAQRHLSSFLLISSIVLLLALPAAFMPFSWMSIIHSRLGMGELPDAPIVSYLARSASILYASLGGMYLFLRRDVMKYLDLLRALALLKMCVATALWVIDLGSGMPLWWSVVEGPGMVAWSVALYYLVLRVHSA